MIKDKKLLILVFLGIVGLVAVSGCTSGNNQTSSSGNTVTIQNMAFNPSTLNVQVGTVCDLAE